MVSNNFKRLFSYFIIIIMILENLRAFLDCIAPFKRLSISRLWIGTHPFISFHKADNLEVFT